MIATLTKTLEIAKPAMSNDLLEAALEYADLGFRVFPLRPGTKLPATVNGCKDATTDVAAINETWKQTPYNIGIATDGLLVLDIDGRGNPWLNAIGEKAFELMDCPIVITPRKGSHRYYKQPAGKRHGNTTSAIAPDVDTRADGGYVVAPPSNLEGGGGYRWLPENELGELTEPPAWLLERLADKPEGSSVRIDTPEVACDPIAAGARNSTLASLGGHMRRMGLDHVAINEALQSVNVTRCQPPMAPVEVEKIAKSVGRYEPDQIATAGAENHYAQVVGGEGTKLERFTLAELIEKHPKLHPPVVDGLFREGETVNIIASPKVGKSWLAYDLALSIITGESWLGRFPTSRGKVLLVDNELHPETIAHRIPKVATAIAENGGGIFPSDYENDLDIWSLRGKIQSLESLESEFNKIELGRYRLIILDAKYRFASAGTSENDNSAETLFYNTIDRIAERIKTSIAMIHHASKGLQSGKAVTDIGSGAGAQSRAADCHIVIREHEEPGVFVLDAAVRSFPPMEPLAMRWTHPQWVPTDAVDVSKLMGLATKGEDRQKDRDKEGVDAIAKALLDGPGTARSLREKTPLGKDRLQRLLDGMVFREEISKTEIIVRNNKCAEYQLPKPDE